VPGHDPDAGTTNGRRHPEPDPVADAFGRPKVEISSSTGVMIGDHNVQHIHQASGSLVQVGYLSIFLPPPRLVDRPRQLPFEPAGFFGRTDALARLDLLLAADTSRMAVVTGAAGVGKTALAVRWAGYVNLSWPRGSRADSSESRRRSRLAGTGTPRTPIVAAAPGEDGSTPSQPKSGSITLALNATDPIVSAGTRWGRARHRRYGGAVSHRRLVRLMTFTRAFTDGIAANGRSKVLPQPVGGGRQ